MWFRILIISLLVLVVLRLVNKLRLPGRKEKNPPVAAMVRCAYCNLFLPEHDALAAGGRYYCCEEHKSLGQK